MKPPPTPEIEHRQTTLGARNVRELLVEKRRNLAGSRDRYCGTATSSGVKMLRGTATSSGVEMLRLDTNYKLQYEQLLICCAHAHEGQTLHLNRVELSPQHPTCPSLC